MLKVAERAFCQVNHFHNDFNYITMLVDFFDSEYVSQHYSLQDETYTIHLLLWNNKPAKIVFWGVIGFYFFPIANPIGLRCEISPSQFFCDMLSFEFETIPNQHEYKCYEILNVDEAPLIKVVSQGYNYIVE